MKKWFAQVLVALLLISSVSLAKANDWMGYWPVAPSTPGEACISGDEAILIAKQEMASRYRRPVSDFDRHKEKARFVRLQNGEEAWIVMIDHSNEVGDVGAAMTLSPGGETVLNYVSSDGKELTDVLHDQWTSRKGDRRFWSIEDKALFDWLYGSSETYVVPAKEHIRKEKAARIALSAISEKLDSPHFSYLFKLLSSTDGKSEQYVWLVTIHVGGEARYVVYVSAVDGTVMELFEVSDWG